MFSVDLTQTRRQALLRGFWKGLAAPLMLFGSFELPAQAMPRPFQPLARRPHAPVDDWVAVGNQLRQAAERERLGDGA